tara:strand:- start:1576 stop:1761 length:186 start_codon:yes stop_codon:yes gene_type:complete
MAIKVAATTVVTNALELQAIATMDGTTQATVNAAIAAQNNVLRIYDSAGTQVREFHCGIAV